MNSFAEYRFETLVSEEGLALYRGGFQNAPFSILMRVQVDARAEPDPRLAHECALASHLDPQWSAVPMSLDNYDGRPALALSDPGGRPLSTRITAPLRLVSFLKAAAGIASALGHVHRSGLVHGDIRPGNILVDDGGRAWITGFGMAMVVPPGQRLTVPAARMSGSFPYMAPEQTGRMNRPVDHRADLYALGVTLYEVVSGQRPFDAKTPLEWVHSHMARAPRPFTLRGSDLPGQISAVILKLLAKAAVDRYQTAAGLEEDLRRCLHEWEATGSISAFALGAADTPGRILIPETLYGRTGERACLTAAFDRVVARAAMKAVLVSGPSGIGKTALINELQKYVITRNGLFAVGKFDQYKRDVPYAPLAQAVQGLVEQILYQTGRERGLWRDTLIAALAPNGRLMTNLVPSLEHLIGVQPPLAALPAAEALTRFDATFRRLLEGFATTHHPLTLFLDDLQWLDPATLDFLRRVIADGGVRNLLLVGAYRAEEVPADHPLLSLFTAMQASEVVTERITLGPLTAADIGQMLAETLSRAPHDVAGLAASIFQRTQGNPFFVSRLISSLAEQGHISRSLESGEWTWRPEAIATATTLTTATGLVAERLQHVPPAARHVLTCLACLGTGADIEVLALASGCEPERIDALMRDIVREGLLIRSRDTYAFAHDRIQEAAYALLDGPERLGLHVAIGRTLLRGLEADHRGDRIFEVVSQFTRGSAALEPDDRVAVARLHLSAGHRAKEASAYRSALDYLTQGRDLLSLDLRQQHPDLAFALDLDQAECEFLCGDTVAAEASLARLVGFCASTVQSARVAALQITLYTATDRSAAAIGCCLDYMRTIGIDWSAHPGPQDAQSAYGDLIAALDGRSVEALTALPPLDRQDVAATLDVLAAALPPAFFSDPHLVALLLCRMTTLSVQYGISDASALGFAYLGMIVGPYFGDYPLAFRFGKLGLDLAETRDLTWYRARILMTFAYHVSPWTRDIRETRPLLISAFEEARTRGDITYCGFSSVTLVTSMLAAGDPLDEVERLAVSRLAYVRKVKFGLCIDILMGQLRLIRQLRGLTPDVRTFNEAGFSELLFEDHLAENRSLDIAACWYWVRKMQGRFLAGDHAGALVAERRAAPLLWTSSGHFELAEYHFYAALTWAAGATAGAADTRPAILDAVDGHLRLLDVWASNAPDNFHCRALLVRAERARLIGDAQGAAQAFDAAIASAQALSLPHVEGLAHERSADFYRAQNLPSTALAHAAAARLAFLRWGAAGKVRQLEQLWPGIAPAPEPAGAAGAGGGTLTAVDLDTFLRTSTAMTGQASIDDFMTMLLEVVLEHAGASRGLLILSRGERLQIEAEAVADTRGALVNLTRMETGPALAPEAMIHAVIRDSAAICIDDARLPHAFSDDPYFKTRPVRSVFCLPLIRRAKVIAILYLENYLATHVFNPEKVNVLNLLASQAAIALESAALEEKEALLREVHHRVKNNLQLITSLLNLQSQQASDTHVAELFAESRNRVRSMALVHENLYRLGNFARVSMKPHLESVCAQLFHAYSGNDGRVTLSLNIDDVKLDLDRAVSCGLIVNELVSNALKHGFPDARAGNLSVSLTRLSDHQCILRVTDDGVGIAAPVPLQDAATLGLQLISDLAYQLHGHVDAQWVGGGDVAITFPTGTASIVKP